MLKAGEMFGIITPDQYMQGYWGMMSLFVAAHPEYVNPMNERKAKNENIMGIVIDNGMTIITSETADYYYVAEYAKTIGYKDVNDMLGDYTVK
jgi:ribose transport system substrate-binding protein